MSGRQDVRVGLVAEIDRWEGTVADWRRKLADAVAAEAAVQAGMGDTVLEDPARAESLASELAQARAAQEVAQRAINAAEPKVDATRRAVLEHDVDQLASAASKVRAKLEAHEAKTRELLQAVFDHEGEGDFVRCGSVDFALTSSNRRGYGTFENASSKPWKSDVLRTELKTLEIQEQMIRDVLDGVDPEERLQPNQGWPSPEDQWRMDAVTGQLMGRSVETFYPSCIAGGYDRIVPAPRFARRLAAQEA